MATYTYILRGLTPDYIEKLKGYLFAELPEVLMKAKLNGLDHCISPEKSNFGKRVDFNDAIKRGKLTGVEFKQRRGYWIVEFTY